MDKKQKLSIERLIDIFAIKVTPFVVDGTPLLYPININLSSECPENLDPEQYNDIRQKVEKFLEWMNEKLYIQKMYHQYLASSHNKSFTSVQIMKDMQRKVMDAVVNYEINNKILLKQIFHDFLTGNNPKELKVRVVTVLIDFSNDMNNVDIDSEIKNKFGEDIIIKKIKLADISGNRFEKNTEYLKTDIARYYESSDIVLIDNVCDTITFLFGLHLASISLNKYFELYGFKTKQELYPYGYNGKHEIEYGLFLTRLF